MKVHSLNHRMTFGQHGRKQFHSPKLGFCKQGHGQGSSCLIMSLILITTRFYIILILQGEIWCWSLLTLKRLNRKLASMNNHSDPTKLVEKETYCCQMQQRRPEAGLPVFRRVRDDLCWRIQGEHLMKKNSNGKHSTYMYLIRLGRGIFLATG